MKKIIALAVFLLSMALQSYGQTFWNTTHVNLFRTYGASISCFETGKGGAVTFQNESISDSSIGNRSRTYFLNRFGDTLRSVSYFLDTQLIYTSEDYLDYGYGVVSYDTQRYRAWPTSSARLNNGNFVFGCFPDWDSSNSRIKSIILTDSVGHILRTRFFDDTIIYNTGEGNIAVSRVTRAGNTDSIYFLTGDQQFIIDTAYFLGRDYYNLYKLDNNLDTIWHKQIRYHFNDSFPSVYYRNLYSNNSMEPIFTTKDEGVILTYYHDTDNSYFLNANNGYKAKNYIVKFDKNGNLVWQRSTTDIIGVTDTFNYKFLVRFEMEDSSIVLAIENKDTAIDYPLYEVRLDKNGNTLNLRSYFTSLPTKVMYPIGYNRMYRYEVNYLGLHVVVYDKNFNYLETVNYSLTDNNFFMNAACKNYAGGGFLPYTSCEYYYYGLDLDHPIINFINFDSNLNIYPSKITGKVVLDRNNDCVDNAGDLIRSSALVAHELTTDKYYYRFTNDSGNYSFLLPYGNYTITHPVGANKVNECGAYTTNVTEPITYTGHDFYDTLLPGIKNFRVELFNSRMRPGDSCYVTTFLQNLGTVDVDSVLNIILDNRVTFVDANVTPTAISGDTLKYNLHLVPDSFYVIQLRIIPNTSLIVGDTLHFMAYSPFNNNVDPTSDSVFLDAPAYTAYDPNIKMANQPLYFPKNNDLVYTVCFQNTGNDTARHIIVEDSISNLLDIPTFMLLSSTHDTPEVKWTVGNKVQFIFKNIYLPDSNVNEPASHGSFSYKISPKATANEGDTILNTAYIYFDYNPAIITNTTVNILEKSRVSSVNHLTEQDKIIVYPNPTNGNAYIKLPSSITDVAITITDMSGRVVQQIERSQPTVEISLKEPPGIYLVKIVNKNNNAIYYKRITKY